MQKEVNFQYIFDSSWSEDLLLQRFRLQVLKNPKLFSNNSFVRAKPVKTVKSFNELVNYIQLFNFEKDNYPLYYTIALCLKVPYEENKSLKEPKAIIFQAFWTICPNSCDYKYENELPFNDNMYWDYKIDHLKKHDWLWTPKE